MPEAHYPIQKAARLTGLSPQVIRIWEHRYRAVGPERTPTNRRLYSPRDLERLRLLREATHAGHSIGQMAQLSNDQLRALGLTAPSLEPPRTPPSLAAPTVPAPAPPPLEAWLDECLASVRSLDGPALHATLQRAAAALGALGFLQRLAAPLSQALGDLWRQGEITAAHEHFASARLRVLLGHLAKPFGGSDRAPVLIVATPAGQLHELGALLVGALAANLGWLVTPLGASLPASDLAECGVALDRLRQPARGAAR